MSIHRNNDRVHLGQLSEVQWQGSGILAMAIPASKTARCADQVIGRAKPSSAEANRLRP